MTSFARTLLAGAAAFALGAGFGASALAQGYPSRPVSMVVAYAAGQGTDLVARYFAEELSKALGQPVVIDNRPGSAGNIGTAYAARATPDGYTILMGTNGSHAMNPFLYKDVGFDPLKDFEPVAAAVLIPMAVSANKSLGVESMADLVAAARARPDEIDVALPSVTAQLMLEMLRGAGVPLNGIRYGGSADAQAAVLGGQVPALIDTLGSSRTHFGRLAALGVSTEEPVGALPEIPTIAAQGLEGFSVTAWNALYTVKGTPVEIRDRLEAEMKAIMARPETAETMRRYGFEPAPEMSRAELEAWTASEYEKYKAAISAAGLAVN